MIKFTSNNDFDFQCESVSLLKDAKRDLVKRASALDMLKYAKTPNQEDLHIIAVGAYEGTGFNRNGDAFLEKDCENNHKYFSKSNRAVHRHHKNKPSDPKYGNIKAAAYNKRMRRIELIVGLDKDKCGDILHEQETSGNTNWSMASKQAEDICSWCKHRAKTDKDRCDHIPKNLGEINKLGEMCGMINPDPRWFEISHVRRPADRIGMSLGKLASDLTYKPMTSSDYLNVYGELYIPDDILLSKKAEDKRDLLHKLAEMEKHVEMVSHSTPTNSHDQFIKNHGHKIKQTSNIDNTSMDNLRKMEPSLVLKTLADHGILFSPEDFSKYLFDNRIAKDRVEGMKTHLPHIYNHLDQSDAGQVVNDEKYEPSHIGKTPDHLKKTVKGLHEGHSLEEGPAIRRMMLSHDKPCHTPEPTKVAADLELAKQYATYKLAALNYLNEQGKLTEDILLNSILQNQ
jgi:hypothetical protein